MGKGKKLHKPIEIYLKKLHTIYVQGNFREESFYSALKEFIEKTSKLFTKEEVAEALVLPKKTETGIPDFLIRKNGEIIGYIEAKTPGTDLNKTEKSEQLRRYREALPNLLLTNFLEFRLYRYGQLVKSVEIGYFFALQDLKIPPPPKEIESFSSLLEEFFAFSTPEIRNSEELSSALAKRTKFLEKLLKEELLRGNEEIVRFFRAFKEELLETLTEEKFADLYAQTITYGLFAARTRVKNGFTKELAWQHIPESLSLLREIFYSFTGPHFPESLAWTVDEIAQVLEKADMKAILKEFETTRWEKDPVVHFYETFLSVYNPREREKLGVYYTPLPVVSYIVRSIHWLLKEKFGKEEGLATRDITLLDPAAGTLTFLVQAIKLVAEELKNRRQDGLIQTYVKEHILNNFYAFEILVTPYTVGHIKASMVLEELGYKLNKSERIKFYLTNTLEMKVPTERGVLIELAKEANEAKKVKEEIPILVILGNPPYSVSSENKSEFIEKLMEDYKEEVRTEKNIQPLSDDYIKFIRFAHWKIQQAGKGIIGFITNNSYLSGVIHRGMRKKLLETFDELYILNLHGSSRIGEKTPQGEKDENVFDIQQGVAIVFFVKRETPAKEKRIFYADLWGLRKEKYDFLFKNDISTTKWRELKAVAPYYFFVPKDFGLLEEYEKFWKVTEIFKEKSFGITTSRDHFVVGFTKEELLQRIRIFTGESPDELVRRALKLKDTRTWKLLEARKRSKGEQIEERIYPYAYRPFDNRYICYNSVLIERNRWNIMKHILEKENFGLVLTRGVRDLIRWSHVFISSLITDKNLISIKDNSYFFPLYLYPGVPHKNLFEKEDQRSSTQKQPNFTSMFLDALRKPLGMEPSPEEIFYYIYAVLYSPTYRKRYQEFLKIDFPRIPLPKDHESFKKLSNLGKELVRLHLLKHPVLINHGIAFPVSGSNIVEKIKYEESTLRVYFNKRQYFEGISKDVWEYRIGAYQVMEKYLKDRKGRKNQPLTLDEIKHYQKMAKAIEMTMIIQSSIDEVFNSLIR